MNSQKPEAEKEKFIHFPKWEDMKNSFSMCDKDSSNCSDILNFEANKEKIGTEYSPWFLKHIEGQLHFESITATPEFCNKSFEELRVEDLFGKPACHMKPVTKKDV